jgi:hypothetical protein
VLGPSGLRRTRGGQQRRWYSSLQCHSDEEKTGERASASLGGVTRRPNPKRSWGAILTYTKDDDTVEGLLVFAKALSFAGSVGTKILASSTSQAPLSLKRSSGVRRGGRDSSSFAAAGWRQRMPGGDFEEGSSRHARALHSAPSASEGSRGQPRWQPEDGARKSPTLSAGPFQLAAE